MTAICAELPVATLRGNVWRAGPLVKGRFEAVAPRPYLAEPFAFVRAVGRSSYNATRQCLASSSAL
jgi:hypothetical protein